MIGEPLQAGVAVDIVGFVQLELIAPLIGAPALESAPVTVPTAPVTGANGSLPAAFCNAPVTVPMAPVTGASGSLPAAF